MTDAGSTVLLMALCYAALGAVLLALLLYARLDWRLKAAAIVVVSAFYIGDFFAARSLLGWASDGPLPHYYKLLQARVVEPEAEENDSGHIYLWVEALGDDNRPISAPRAYRVPYTSANAGRAERAIAALAEGRPQGGLTDDRGRGMGGDADPVRPHVNQEMSQQTSGGDPSAGNLAGAVPSHDVLNFVPLLAPRMPPKDRLQE